MTALLAGLWQVFAPAAIAAALGICSFIAAEAIDRLRQAAKHRQLHADLDNYLAGHAE